MQKLVFRNPNGEEIDFTSGDFGVTKWEGFSHVDMDLQTQQVPFNDGSVFLDALLSERELNVTVAINDNGDLEKRYRLKRELIHCLNPKLGEGELIYTNDYTSKKIVCVPAIPEFENKNINDRGSQKASCTFNASNPYWEDVEETEVYFDVLKQAKINNNGDVPCEIVADIIGIQAKNPRLMNVTTNKKIKYDGTIENSLRIETTFGNKKVETEEMNYNLMMGGSFKAVASNKSITVAVGKYILMSEDGETWTQQFSGINDILNSVCWNKKIKKFIAVGQNGTILSSPDGETWTQETCGINNILYSVCYSDDLELLIAVGDAGIVLSSEDGETWTSQTSGISQKLNNVIYVPNNYFIAVGESGTIITSPDGEIWTQVSTSVTNTAFTSVCYSEELEKFAIATYDGRILRSTDGSTWLVSGTISPVVLRCIMYSPILREFIAIASSSISKTSDIYTSSDCETWTTRVTVKDDVYAVIYSMNIDSFCIIGNNGMIAISQNLLEWEEKRNALLNTIYSICYSEEKGLFCAVGSSGFIAISADGFNWESITPIGNKNILDVIYAKGLFVAVGTKGYDFGVITSPDGRTWTDTGYYSNRILSSICYSEELDLFCAVGTDGNSYQPQSVIITSPDGLTWSLQGTPVMNCKNFLKVIYVKSKGKFYAVGASNGIVSSEDGVTWIDLSPSPLDVDNLVLHDISYSEKLNLFVITGQPVNLSDYTSFVLTSSNETTWIKQKFQNNFTKIAYNNKINLFCIAENGGNNLLSTDGLTWDELETNSMTPQKIIFIESLSSFYIVGDVILGSYFTNILNQIDKITEDSDMDLKLAIGENIIRFVSDNGIGSVILKYKQKYLGV
jgi:photosystem II stability/assembly factor-like uncharacterized protein